MFLVGAIMGPAHRSLCDTRRSGLIGAGCEEGHGQRLGDHDRQTSGSPVQLPSGVL